MTTHIPLRDASAKVTRLELGTCLAEVDPIQICRTCSHEPNRLWHLSSLARLKLSPPDRAEGACAPDQQLAFDVVRTRGGVRYAEHISGVERFDEWAAAPEAEPTTVAMVSSCGWTGLDKCLRCARFQRVVVNVPYPQHGGERAPVRFRPQVVGGHCSIPPEGIDVKGRSGVTCDFVRRTDETEASCLNCEFRFDTGINWMLDEFDREIVATDLDPYELFKVREQALRTDPSAVGLAIWRARRDRLSDTTGLWRYFRARVLERQPGRTHVEFYGSAHRVWLNADPLDPTDVSRFCEVIDLDDTHAMVRITGPHWGAFGLATGSQRLRVVIPRAGKPGQAVLRPLAPRHPERIEPGCPSCQPKLARACYYHAKAPRERPLGGSLEVLFEDPGATDPHHDAPVGDEVHLVRDGAVVRVVDRHHHTPSPLAFSVALRSLYAHARGDERSQVLRQYFAAVAGCERQRVTYEPGYGRPLGLEQFKPYCALALPRTVFKHDPARGYAVPVKFLANHAGIDLRQAMGDRFGMMAGEQWDERSPRDTHYTRRMAPWAERLDIEDYIRGTNIHERLTEEYLTTEAVADARRRGLGLDGPADPSVWDRAFTTTYYEAEEVNGELVSRPIMAVHADGTEEPDHLEAQEWAEIQAESRRIIVEHKHRLTTVPVPRPDGSIEEVALPTMWVEDGVANFAGGLRSRADEAALFDFNHLHSAEDIAEVFFGWQCPLHEDHRYSPEEVALEGNHCPVDGARLYWVAAGDEEQVSVTLAGLKTIPGRQRRGIGNAVAPDHKPYQTQTMLSRMVCPHWVRKGSNPLRPIRQRA